MESLRALPRNIAVAALALVVAVACVELLTYALGALAPTALVPASVARAESVLLVSPAVLIFYAGPLIGPVARMGRASWPLAGLFGLLPGLALGALAGLAVYGSVVGLLAGLAALGLSRLCLGSQRGLRGHG